MTTKSPLPTPKEFEILSVLETLYSEGMYGLEIVRASQGRVSRGSVYLLLNELVDKGLVTSEAMDDPFQSGTPRRKYRITEDGVAAWVSGAH